MTCASCGRSNRGGAAFCAGCGRKLDACDACGAGLIEDAPFCDACGAAVPQVFVAPAPAPTDGRVRKVVTVLFADVAGSTSFQERVDAESARTVMSRLHRLLAEVVDDHGGTVVKFVGDGTMVVFGARAAREDDAVRAVRAGLAMQVAFRDLADTVRAEYDVDLGLRVGINSGEVVVDPGDDDIVGDPVNVAARLEAAADEGTVLIGAETGRLVRDHLPVEAVPPLVLRGKAEPVAAFRVLEGDHPAGSGASALTSFVGRQDDTGRLERQFDLAVTGRRARLVTVIGSPGLGKSRLAQEVAARLRGRARVLTARCDSAGASTFGPLADALRHSFDLDERSAPEQVLAAVRRAAGEDDPDADRIAGRTAGLLGVGPAGTAEETFWAVRRLLEGMARQGPVVLVIDDVHWAEPALLDLVLPPISTAV